MSVASGDIEKARAMRLAAALTNSTSFADSSEIAEVLSLLGYDVSSLSNSEIVAELDRRCASALQQLQFPTAD